MCSHFRHCVGYHGQRVISSFIISIQRDVGAHTWDAGSRQDVPIASNAFTSQLVQAFVQKAMQNASDVAKAVQTLSADGKTPLHFQDLCGLLKSDQSFDSESLRVAWGAAHLQSSRFAYPSVNQSLLPHNLATAFSVVGLPVFRTFWNLGLGLEYCKTLQADASGARSLVELPPGA